MITTDMIKILREKTGAGIMECKKALTEAKCDMEKAAGIIRKKGLAAAVKKAERVTSEGSVEVYISEDGTKAGIIELKCETDFVASNAEFKKIAKNLAIQAALSASNNLNKFLMEKYMYDKSITVNDVIMSLIARLGENILLSRMANISSISNHVQTYTHGQGRIGVIVEISCNSKNLSILEFSKEIAMQIAAANPIFINRSFVDEEMLNIKREKFRNQCLNEGKPEKVVDKIAEGKIQKYLREICLMEQPWIKNPDYTIERYLKEKSTEIGADITIVSFVRFERGEEIRQK